MRRGGHGSAAVQAPLGKGPGGLPMIYALAIACVLAGVAALRSDLLLRSLAGVGSQWAKGGLSAARIAFETALFVSILACMPRLILDKAEPRRDLRIVLFAAVLSAFAEAWGTRTGLWRYYTREAPPLWLLPVWPLGALVMDRFSDRLRRLFADRFPAAARATGYWAVALLTLAAFAAFTRPAWGSPATWLMAAVVAAGLLFRPEPEQGFWVLAAGLPCIFLADLWGTNSNCWRYHIQAHGSHLRQFLGVGFAMLFDTSIVLASLRLAGRSDG
ncbi:MAG: hypothetical protein WC728_08700 [Elusimicrobiota bacterium]